MSLGGGVFWADNRGKLIRANGVVGGSGHKEGVEKKRTDAGTKRQV